MSTSFSSPKAYIDSLSEERRKAVKAIRKVIRANLDSPFKEGIQYNMLGYFLPHSVYPDGYHCNPKEPLPFVGVASQKNYISIYLFCVYTSAQEEERFRKEWLATGKKLDMGKSCVRIKKLEDLPLEVLGHSIKRMTAKKFIASYEGVRPAKKGVSKKGVSKKSV